MSRRARLILGLFGLAAVAAGVWLWARSGAAVWLETALALCA